MIWSTILINLAIGVKRRHSTSSIPTVYIVQFYDASETEYCTLDLVPWQ